MIHNPSRDQNIDMSSLLAKINSLETELASVKSTAENAQNTANTAQSTANSAKTAAENIDVTTILKSINKTGTYTGTTNSSAPTLTLGGFPSQPKLLIIQGDGSFTMSTPYYGDTTARFVVSAIILPSQNYGVTMCDNLDNSGVYVSADKLTVSGTTSLTISGGKYLNTQGFSYKYIAFL